MPIVSAPQPLRLSVIIPSYNNPVALITCLKALVATAAKAGSEGRLEILIQDDASPSFKATELIGSPISVAINEINLGFAGNCNVGAVRTSGDILLFLNQDTKARPDWFEPLMAMFDNPQVGIVGPKLIFGQNPHGKPGDSIQSCGGLYDGGKGPYHRYLGWAADDWRVNICERVSWTTGAALAIRRELFVKAGGFDTAYRIGYFEDVDLCEKVKALGAEVWYCPEACFEHSVGSSGGVSPSVFKANSILFHNRWNDKITPDTTAIYVNY